MKWNLFSGAGLKALVNRIRKTEITVDELSSTVVQLGETVLGAVEELDTGKADRDHTHPAVIPVLSSDPDSPVPGQIWILKG